MKDYIKERTLQLADYILETGATVRDAAKLFLVSKSTVHKDVTGRLKQIDFKRYLKVKKIMDFNLSERHIRGGISTKNRFKKTK